MSRSLNKVILIGNLTRDPEMRYTPQGHAVTTVGLATNRDWKVEGEKREETEFHTIVCWNKLAELCVQLLKKGTKVYIEGRLQTRDWVDDKGLKHYKTEVIAEDMIVLSARKEGVAPSEEPEFQPVEEASEKKKEQKAKEPAAMDEEIGADEIPF